MAVQATVEEAPAIDGALLLEQWLGLEGATRWCWHDRGVGVCWVTLEQPPNAAEYRQGRADAEAQHHQDCQHEAPSVGALEALLLRVDGQAQLRSTALHRHGAAVELLEASAGS